MKKRKVLKNLLNLPTGCTGKSKSKSHQERDAPQILSSKSTTNKKDELFEGIYIQPAAKLPATTEESLEAKFTFLTLPNVTSQTQKKSCRDASIVPCDLDNSLSKTSEDVRECNKSTLLTVDKTSLPLNTTYGKGDETKTEKKLDIAAKHRSISDKTSEFIQKVSEEHSSGHVSAHENECKLTFTHRRETLSNDDAQYVDVQQKALKSKLGLEESLQLIVNPKIISSKNNDYSDKYSHSVLGSFEKEIVLEHSNKMTEPANQCSSITSFVINENCARTTNKDVVYSPKMFSCLSPKRVISKKSTVKKITHGKTLSTPSKIGELGGVKHHKKVSNVGHDVRSNNVTRRSEDTVNLLAQSHSFKSTNNTAAASSGSKRYRRKHCFVISPKRVSLKYKKVKRTCLRNPYCCCCCGQCHCCYHQHCARTFDHSTCENTAAAEDSVDASFNSLEVQIDNLSIRTLSEGSDSDRSWNTVHSATSNNSRPDSESPVRLQHGRFEVKRTHSARVQKLSRSLKFSPKFQGTSRVKVLKKQVNNDRKFKLNRCQKTSPLRKPVCYYGKGLSTNSSNQAAVDYANLTYLHDRHEEHYSDDAYFQPFVQSEDELKKIIEKRTGLSNKRLIDLHKKSSNSIPNIGQLQLQINYQFGMLTVEVIQARNLQPQKTSLSNTYVKLSLVPDQEKRTYCTTDMISGTNCPDLRQLFSFELLPDDSSKRLLISVWNKLFKSSEFLGCMSFGVKHLLANSRKGVYGWFYLLDEKLGRRKHLACTLSAKSATNGQQKFEYL